MNLFWAILMIVCAIAIMIVACCILAEQQNQIWEEYSRENELDDNSSDSFDFDEPFYYDYDD